MATHKLVAAAVGVALVVAIGVAASPGDDLADPPPGPSPSQSSLSPTISVASSPTPAASPSPPPPPPPPPAAPKIYSGSGDRIIRIQKPSGRPSEPVIATIDYTGSSNFIVWTLNRNLRQDQLLVNTIGGYHGTVLMDLEQGQATTRLQIEGGGGTWKIAIKPIERARSFSGSTRGRGDDVLLYRGSRGVANVRYVGRDNIIIWFYGDTSDLLVNEIGNYRGQVILGDGPALLTVEGGSGTWSIKVS